MAKDAIIIFLTLVSLNACRARDLGRARALVQASAAPLPEAAYRPPPTLLGADSAPLVALSGALLPGAAAAFEFHELRRVGTDLRLSLKPRESV